MKIGILTQPLMNNYGGLLQNYALQTVLKRLGHMPYTINITYKNNWIKRIGSIIKRISQRMLGEKVRIRVWPTAKESLILSQNTRQFIKKNIKTTIEIKKKIDMKYLTKYKFDVFIVGSDQVWRPAYSPQLSTYYLSFLKNSSLPIKKLAYSASFGVDNWEYSAYLTGKYRELIKKFDAISVREDTAVEFCKRYFQTDTIQTLDPTFLLNKNDYIELVDKEKNSGQEKYLFTYILDNSENNNKIVNIIAKTYKLKLRSGMPVKQFIDFGKRTLEECIFPSISDFIQGVQQANFVITDSFHGTVFSIIFNKPFISIANKGRGETRFTSLLKLFNLEDRLINSPDLSSIDLLKEINWNEVNSILKQRQEESLNFLIKNLN
jgi:polysaccharide pyruvyl transferase WcaK-like protein